MFSLFFLAFTVVDGWYFIYKYVLPDLFLSLHHYNFLLGLFQLWSIIHRGYYICVHGRRCLRHECLDYLISRARNHNLDTNVVNIVSHGHECNILFICVELLN